MTTSPERTDAVEQGVRVHSVLADLVRDTSEILEIELLYLPVPPSVEGRPGATPRLRQHAAAARAAQPPGDSFTETFIAIADRHGDLSAALEVVAFHQPLSNAYKEVRLKREETSAERIRLLAEAAAPHEILVVTSRVRTPVGWAHIPMLDFKLPTSEQNVSVVQLIARRLGGGVVLDSGSSYHLYGHGLLSDDQLREWLLRAQLLSRCVDTRWVTHQLLERRAALRIGAGGSSGMIPISVCRTT